MDDVRKKLLLFWGKSVFVVRSKRVSHRCKQVMVGLARLWRVSFHCVPRTGFPLWIDISFVFRTANCSNRLFVVGRCGWYASSICSWIFTPKIIKRDSFFRLCRPGGEKMLKNSTFLLLEKVFFALRLLLVSGLPDVAKCLR